MPTPEQLAAAADRRDDILARVAAAIRDTDFAPTVAELSTATGVPTRRVRSHLDALDERGLIRRVPGMARGIVLTRAGRAHLRELGEPAATAPPARTSATA